MLMPWLQHKFRFICLQRYSFFTRYFPVAVLKYVFLSHFSHPYLCNINHNDMDISNLTSLINALRAETQEDSITPESLGALLQRIAEVCGCPCRWQIHRSNAFAGLPRIRTMAGLRHRKGNSAWQQRRHRKRKETRR